MQCPLLEDLLKLLDETQSHRKEPHVIRSNTVITSCEKGRKWFLSSVLWIDAKFVGVMESLRARLFTASCASISLVPFRLHFVFTTVTNSPARRHYRHQAWYHFDFTPSALPSPVLEPFRLHFIVLVTKSVTSLLRVRPSVNSSASCHMHRPCRHQGSRESHMRQKRGVKISEH